MSRRKITVYRPNQYELVNYVLLKQKNLGGHRHDLLMCQVSDIFKMVDFRSGAENKNIGTFPNMAILYTI